MVHSVGTAESIVGLRGSGLTNHCVSRFAQLLDRGVVTDRIVVLVRNSEQAQSFRQRILQTKETVMGVLRIQGFTVFVEQQLRNYWTEVSQKYPNLPTTFQPIFSPKDLTQFLLSQAIATCPFHADAFQNCPLESYQILDQIVSDAYIASCSLVDRATIGDRLSEAWIDPEAIETKKWLQSISCCVQKLRQQALSHQVLDFGFAMELFSEVIIHLDRFWEAWDYLIVDQVEESSEVFLQFYQKAQEQGKHLFFAYTIGGGSAFTAMSDRVATFLVNKTNWKLIDTVPGMGGLGLAINHQLESSLRIPKLPICSEKYGDRVHLLQRETYLDAIEEMVQRIQVLLDSKVKNDQIAIILPETDQVVLQLLQNSALSHRLAFLNPYGSFLRYPLVRSMLTIAEVAHPQWGMIPNSEQVASMLSFFLRIDRVRATLLTQAVWHQHLQSGQQVPTPERIGFHALNRYEKLRSWIMNYHQQSPLLLDLFWGSIFQNFSHQMPWHTTDREVFKSLIETARRFYRSLPSYRGPEFLWMLLSGQTPTIFSKWETTDRIVVATPLRFLATKRLTQYQFWFDITAAQWRQPVWHILMNHRVLTQDWQGGIFTVEKDRHLSNQQLARTLLNLLCRNQEAIYLVSSFTTVQGEDNVSHLDELILKAAKQLD